MLFLNPKLCSCFKQLELGEVNAKVYKQLSWLYCPNQPWRLLLYNNLIETMVNKNSCCRTFISWQVAAEGEGLEGTAPNTVDPLEFVVFRTDELVLESWKKGSVIVRTWMMVAGKESKWKQWKMGILPSGCVLTGHSTWKKIAVGKDINKTL